MRYLTYTLNLIFIALAMLGCKRGQLVNTDPKSVTVDGYRAQWYFESDDVVFEISAPTTGWVTIGFNPRNNIVGSNLIMGAVVDGRLILEDQFVTGVGIHPTISQLGGTPV